MTGPFFGFFYLSIYRSYMTGFFLSGSTGFFRTDDSRTAAHTPHDNKLEIKAQGNRTETSAYARQRKLYKTTLSLLMISHH